MGIGWQRARTKSPILRVAKPRVYGCVPSCVWIVLSRLTLALQDAWSDLAPKHGSGDNFKQGDQWIRSELIKLPADRGKADGEFPGEGVIQPSIWESKDHPGHCHMMMRSSVGCVIQADSTDYGRTWGPAFRTSLPNNNSGLCVTALRDGRIVW
jgi:hypothetical protein